MELLKDPTIKLTLTGLFLLCFGENKSRCEVGIVHAEDHCLKIRVKRATPLNTVDYAILPAELLTEDIYFEIPGRPGGVDIFLGSPDFPRRSDQDFRWIIDLEGEEFHDRKLQIKQDATFQRIFINQGQFHTAKKREVRIQSPGSASSSPANVAQVVGCNVVLTEGEKAVLRFGQNRLEFSGDGNTSYEIEIENLCMPAEGSEESMGDGDFHRLYDALIVDDNQKFAVRPPIGFENALRPCDAGELGKHTSLDDKT